MRPARTEAPFLLTGIGPYQRLLTGPTWRVFFVLAIPGTVMVLLSIPFGVASIPVTYPAGFTADVGFLHRNNWTWPYILVVPMALLLLRRLSSEIRSSVADLEEMGVLAQTERAAGRTFVERLEHRLDGTAKHTVIGIALVLGVFTVADTLDLVRGYHAFVTSTQACPFTFYEADWSVAFSAHDCWGATVADPGFDPPGLWRNAAFNLVPYALQTLMIFGFLIWFVRLTQFFFFLSSSLTGGEFRIVPMFDDPLRRLGLGPLGGIYNTFLTLILVFEIYVAGHRIQQIALVNGVSIGTYLQELLRVASEPTRWLDPTIHEFATVDVGTGVLVVAVAVLITLICWFPLFQMRAYIRRRKLELSKAFAIQKSKATEEGDQAEVERLAANVKLLGESNIWPNGDSVAQHFITGMAVLWLGAIFPVVFVVVALGAFGLLELIRFTVWAGQLARSRKPARPT